MTAIKALFFCICACLLVACESESPVHHVDDWIPLAPPKVEQCRRNDLPTEGCTVVPGDERLLIVGDLLAGDRIIKNGSLLIAPNGRVAAIGCDVAGTDSATQLRCGKRWIVPGLINLHEHLVYDHAQINVRARYLHRNEWRKGLNGKPRYDPAPLPGNPVTRVELRHLLHGTTSIAAAESQHGLARNLNALELHAGVVAVTSSTFPLEDQHQPGFGVEECDYDGKPEPGDIDTPSFIAHLAEGTTAAATHELRCMWKFGWENDPRLAVAHGIRLEDADIATLARSRQSVIWSPRSNLALYGQTAPVGKLIRAKVKVAIATDWSSTGSTDLQSEARCALDHAAAIGETEIGYDRLLAMVTRDAARAANLGNRLGELRVGHWADLLIVRQHGSVSESVLGGGAERFEGVFIAGRAVVRPDRWTAIPDARRCETLSDVCGEAKTVCGLPSGRSLASELGRIRGRAAPWRCGAPQPDPVCAR
jgi:cytosine/adenosine deaminase-related metal-dependent hydrolase